jgi:flagellar biosynthesis GTPase FlhF
VLATAGELSHVPGVERVEPGEPGRPARFTTRELLEVEREALELGLSRRNVSGPRPDERVLLRTLIQSRALSNEQRMLVREASLSPDGIVCVVGVAGAGKTTALRVLADAHAQSGIPVLGAAPSGRAADELAAATGIHATTLHRLLRDAQLDGVLPRSCLLVVDEAGMAETRVLAPLLRFVDEAGGKAILVGDPAQLPAVGAGGLFSAMCERLGALELTQNRRQVDADERAALGLLRSGNPEPYLAHAAARGRLHIDDDVMAAKLRLLADWWRAAATDPARTVMLAYRRDDVRNLNDAARVLMLESGQLGQEALSLGEREFRVGDRIVCRSNNPRLGVRNGMRGTVIDLDPSTRTLTLQTDAGPRRCVLAGYAAEHVDHGYALTGHTAQGATVDRAFVLARDKGALREWGYVACSRARMETRLYVVGDALEPEDHGRPVDERDPTARLAGALERSAAEQPALMQRPDTSHVKRRTLERCRRQREQALETAERRLATAEKKLRGPARLGRRSQRAELQAEISRQQSAVRLARTQLAELPREQPERRPSRSPRARFEPEQRVLTRVREPNRDLGLER